MKNIKLIERHDFYRVYEDNNGNKYKYFIMMNMDDKYPMIIINDTLAYSINGEKLIKIELEEKGNFVCDENELEKIEIFAYILFNINKNEEGV